MRRLSFSRYKKEVMKRNLHIGVLYLFGLLFIPSPFVFAADYLGAVAVLEKASQKTQPGAADEKPAEMVQLKRDIESLKKQSAALPPHQAPRHWLKLLDRPFNLSPTDTQSELILS